MTMERYAHITAAQQRDATDLLDEALTGEPQSVASSVTRRESVVVRSGPDMAREAIPRGEGGSGAEDPNVRPIG